MFLAHVENEKIQTVKQHSENTALLAKSFSTKNLEDLNYLIGLFHDIGKYQNSFQKRITGDKSIKIAHALCGAKEADNIFKNKAVGMIMQYCIAGHHTGLQDCGTIADKNTPEELTTLYATLARQVINLRFNFEENDRTLHPETTELQTHYVKNCDMICFNNTKGEISVFEPQNNSFHIIDHEILINQRSENEFDVESDSYICKIRILKS